MEGHGSQSTGLGWSDKVCLVEPSHSSLLSSHRMLIILAYVRVMADRILLTKGAGMR